jgi:hypothetical protein
VAAPDFESSVDFETQLPRLAQASSRQRGLVDLQTVREAVRRLFALLEDQEFRDSFFERIADEAREPIRDEVFRQIRQRDNASRYWDERGGVDGATMVELTVLLQRFRTWVALDLRPWLEDIFPILDPDAWVGEWDRVSGAVDTLLLADAIGMHAYSWGLHVDEPRFRRLDVVAGSEPGMVVLSELYSQSVEAYA